MQIIVLLFRPPVGPVTQLQLSGRRDHNCDNPAEPKNEGGVLHVEDWEGEFYRAFSAVCPGVALLPVEKALLYDLCFLVI